MQPEKRYQVFVSSTYEDLREARASVQTTLLGLRAFPAGMELFPAANDDAWQLIKSVIDESDYYLLIIGGRYGSISPQTGLSYTEMEYDYAVSLKMPVMAFICAERDELPKRACERTEEGERRLEDFIRKVGENKHYKRWKNIDDLGKQVAITWDDFRRRYPAIGWIRADRYPVGPECSINACNRVDSCRSERNASSSNKEQRSEEDFNPGEVVEIAINIAGSLILLSSGSSVPVTFRTSIELSLGRVFSALKPNLERPANSALLKRACAEFITHEGRARFESQIKNLPSAKLQQILDREGLSRDQVDLGVHDLSIQIDDSEFDDLMSRFERAGLVECRVRQADNRRISQTWKLKAT